MGRVWDPVSYDEEEVMDSRPLDQDVDQPRMALEFGERGWRCMDCTDGGGRQSQVGRHRRVGSICAEMK